MRERDHVAPLWQRALQGALDYRRIVVIEGDLSQVPYTPPPPGIEIREFEGRDWNLLSEVAAQRHAPAYPAAVRAGRLCLVAWEYDRPVGCAWLSPAVERRYEKVELPLPRDAAYLWHLNVARSEQGRGISAALGSAVCDAARLKGASRIWLGVHAKNRNSLHAASKMGLTRGRVVGVVARTRLLSWTRFAYRPYRSPVTVALAGIQ
jgi:GNAT superfamily N-acetyltransferase